MYVIGQWRRDKEIRSVLLRVHRRAAHSTYLKMKNISTASTIHRQLAPFGTHWDFWLTFAWVETRSVTVLERVYEHRAISKAYHNPNGSTKFTITDVCQFKCHCGKRHDCKHWVTTYKLITELCIAQKLIAYGVPLLGIGPLKIAAECWISSRQTVDPPELSQGTQLWRGICFSESEILRRFPPNTRTPAGKRPPPTKTQQYVAEKYALKWTQQQIIDGSAIHFAPELGPTRQSIKDAYILLNPSLKAGRLRKSRT